MEDRSKFRCGVPVGVGLIRPTILINLMILSLGVPAPATPRDPLGDAGVEAISDSPSTPDHRLPKGDVVLPAAVRDKLRAEHHPERLLVRFRSGRGTGPRQAAHEMARAKRVARSYRHVDGLQLVEVAVGDLATSLAAYSSCPDVLYAEPDYVFCADDVPNDPNFDLLWGLQNVGQTVAGNPGTAGADIGAVSAWDFWAGHPDFRLAIIDSGVNYLHPDLIGNIWTNPGETPFNGIDDDGNGYIDDVHGYDALYDYGDPMDCNGHGSHVAGTIGAVANNNEGVVGVNWECNIVALKIFAEG